MITAETLAAAKEALSKAGLPLDVLKADTFSLAGLSPSATQGLVGYSLEAPSKKLYPILTPLRNMIARVAAMGTAHNWRAVTAINTGQLYGGVPEGARAQVGAVSVKEFSRKYVTLGSEGTVTYEQQSAARTFEDIQALNVLVTLQDTMRKEEVEIVGGNASVLLGTTPDPVLTSGGTDSTLANVAHTVRVVALAHPAWQRAKVANGFGVPMTITHTDPVTGVTTAFGGGSAKISGAVATTPAATAHINATVTAVRGAVAYAWFLGTADGASCKLAKITTINSAVFLALPATTTAGTGYGVTVADFTTNNTDNSTNALGFDGIISLAADSASGAYYTALATGTAGTGTGLTSDGAAGITEIDVMLQSMWDNNRLGPAAIWVAGQDVKRATQRVVAGGGSPLYRFVIDQTGGGNPQNMTITAGSKLGDYLNKFTGQLIPFRVHPDVTPGTILAVTDQLPYPMADVPSVFEMHTRRDYYDIPWPARTRRYEHGTYVEEVLCCYATFALGLIQNVADV